MQINNYVWENDLSLNDLVLKQKEKIERINKKNKELKEQVVSAIRVNNICTENKSIIELQAQRYEQELTITKEKQLKEEIKRLNNIINETKKILLLHFDTTTTIFKALNKLSEADKQC